MVSPNMPVTIQVASFPNRPFTGHVLRIGAEAVVQQNVTTFPVLIRIANHERLLRPGMNSEVEVHIGQVRDALAVPNAALRTFEDGPAAAEVLGIPRGELPRPPNPAGPRETADEETAEGNGTTGPGYGGELLAFVWRNGQAEPRLVTAGLTDFDYTAIISGLAEGDSVVVLPTTGALEQEQQRRQWIQRRVGGPLGGNNR
jgi:HlyD family secretion protein